MVTDRDSRVRVAIVGGGMSGLTAAYELSRTPALRARYDVVVYQMGFRLGGKLASGRNREVGMRNEEHGLHVWFGYYDNTFRLAREIYERWHAPPDCPFRDVWDFAKPQRHGLLGQAVDGAYRMSAVHYPRSCDTPGFGNSLPSLFGLVGGLLDVARAVIGLVASDGGRTHAHRAWLWPHTKSPLWSGPADDDSPVFDAVNEKLGAVLRYFTERFFQLSPARRTLLARATHRMLATTHPGIATVLERLTRIRPAHRPLYHFVDTTLAFVRGLLNPRDGIYLDGDLDRVCDRDFREWLLENGSSEESAFESAWVGSAYDASFQFVDGHREMPTFEASTAARFAIRGYLLYKHAPGFLVDAGMGEAIVAPLYEVLRDQGVRFEFFHRLERMELSRDKRSLAKLHFVKQAHAKGTYEPLFTFKGLRCWPTEPDWSQLERGEELRAAGVDFESRWSPPADDAPVTLAVDRDFDVALLALPLGSVRPDADGHTPCREWIDAVPHVRAAAEGINLMPSIGAQFWFTRDMPALGWVHRPAVIGWSPPLSIWCDMSPVVAYEGWTEPKSCAYLCGVAAPIAPTRSSSDREAPKRAKAEAIAEITAQLEAHGAAMWPGACRADGRFDWNALFDPKHREGPARLAAQYIRVNAEPWDLCDGAAPGNSRLRLAAHDSGLSNVAVAGTWTKTAVNTAGIEAAVMSGLSAARAVGADERTNMGEDILYKPYARASIAAIDELAREVKRAG